MERIIDGDAQNGEEKEARGVYLRPLSFAEFPGQDQVKEKLKVFVQAASERGEPLDHVLLCGPPGLGKTTLARIIANTLEVDCPFWDRYDKRIPQARQRLLKIKNEEIVQKRSQLLEKLTFFQANLLIDEEKDTLDRLSRMFPDDKEIAGLNESLKNRWAREIVSRKASNHQNRSLFERSEPELPDDQERIVQGIWDHVQKKFKKNIQRLAYDFSIMFSFFNKPELSLRVLDFCETSQNVDWLKLEFLLTSGRYVDCLQEISKLEVKYSADPETTFAATYLRAKCLWHLEQRSTAIELMQGIVRIRPSYRSAHSLLIEWSGNAA